MTAVGAVEFVFLAEAVGAAAEAPLLLMDGDAVGSAELAGAVLVLVPCTVTFAVAVDVPKRFVAVRVYCVLTDGLTLTDVPVSLPTPGLMLYVVAAATFQLKTTP
jgi:hypothetical protein